MLNLLLQSHPIFILMESLVIIWDFGLRILDLWNRYALSINNRQNSLTLVHLHVATTSVLNALTTCYQIKATKGLINHSTSELFNEV